jgi:hypothetical protein
MADHIEPPAAAATVTAGCRLKITARLIKVI